MMPVLAKGRIRRIRIINVAEVAHDNEDNPSERPFVHSPVA